MLLLLAVLSFALPLVSLRAALGSRTESIFITSMQSWSVGYAVTAAGLGLVMAILSWSYDHRLRHVYALSLQSRAVGATSILRFSAGLLLLVLPIIALFIGTEIVAASSVVPKTLHSYPVAVTLRFAFATPHAWRTPCSSRFRRQRPLDGRGTSWEPLALMIVAQVVISGR